MKRRTASHHRAHPAHGQSRPTPIRISKRTRTGLVALGGIALVLLMWFAPTVPVVLLGGFAVAMALSFPVRWLSHLMPRGLAILATFLILIGAGILALLVLIPILIIQLASLVKAVPDIAREANSTLRALLEPLSQLGLLPGTPDQFMASLGQDLVDLAQELARQTLGGLVRFLSGAIGVAISLFGVLFVAVYLLANVRKLKSAFLVSAPKRYRRDARQLWGAFAISAVGLYLLGVPYALLLGTWVSITAVIPYLGAWLGAIPAVIVAFTV